MGPCHSSAWRKSMLVLAKLWSPGSSTTSPADNASHSTTVAAMATLTDSTDWNSASRRVEQVSRSMTRCNINQCKILPRDRDVLKPVVLLLSAELGYNRWFMRYSKTRKYLLLSRTLYYARRQKNMNKNEHKSYTEAHKMRKCGELSVLTSSRSLEQVHNTVLW